MDYGKKLVINGLPQFGFHVHTGERYLVEYDKGYIGLIEGDHLAWTAGEIDPGMAGKHDSVNLLRPKYVARAFHWSLPNRFFKVIIVKCSCRRVQ